MKMTSMKFDVEGFDGGLESRRVGKRLEILYFGKPVMSFQVNDLTARDWTIASLLDVGLKGKTIAKLCNTSAAQVSMVAKLVRQGGHGALVHGQRGRRKKLIGAKLFRAIDLRRKGASVAQIGKKLGVSPTTASQAVKGIPRGGEKEQMPLREVGAAPDTSEPSAERSDAIEVEKVEEPNGAAEREDSELSTPATAADSSTPSESPTSPSLPAQSEDLVAPISPLEPPSSQEPTTVEVEKKPQELIPAQRLPSGPAEHPCRYSGTLLVTAAVQVLGLHRALGAAAAHRPQSCWYTAWDAVVALLSAWSWGYCSLESMHERDARALGVVLGFERCPCVRTLHRAIAQMIAVFDPIALGAAMLRGLKRAFRSANEKSPTSARQKSPT